MNETITKGGAIPMGKLASFEPTDGDLALINALTLREMSADEVFVFKVIACNTLPDRDMDRFSKAALDGFAALYPGKPVGRDHNWRSESIVARVYAADVEPVPGMDGEYQLMLRAYIPRTAASAATIAELEAGILREVSVGVGISSAKCSICGGGYGRCDHYSGGEYDGATCYRILDVASDVYELSFCVVPAQPGAGTTKTPAPPDDGPEGAPPEPVPDADDSSEPAITSKLSAALLRIFDNKN